MTCKHFRHENFKVVLQIFVISLSFENYVTGGPLMLDWFESSQLPAIGRSRKRKVLLMDIFSIPIFTSQLNSVLKRFHVFLCIYRFPCRQSLVGGRENFSNWKFVCLRSLVSGHLMDSWPKKNCPEFANQRKYDLWQSNRILGLGFVKSSLVRGTIPLTGTSSNSLGCPHTRELTVIFKVVASTVFPDETKKPLGEIWESYHVFN